jgi:RNA polymerase sigma-70 factor (ECF subfamily)
VALSKQSSATFEFERLVLPHLPGAYNLARWLLGASGAQSAEDIVQDACIRAFEHFGSFRGGDSRAWFLTIVRNSVYSQLRRTHSRVAEISLDDLFDDPQLSHAGPEAQLIADANDALVRQAIEGLPAEFREVVVLKDMHDLSYREIADIAGVPVGTVMSRLNRARKRLRVALCEDIEVEAP